MRARTTPELERCRRGHPKLPDTTLGDLHGFFERGPLRIISSGSQPDQSEWEHVSVSCANRCPTWDEMCAVKDLFWTGEETVVQFHPRKSRYVNRHEFCLHLWRRIGGEEMFPLPPDEAV